MRQGEIVAQQAPERVQAALALRAQGKSWRAVSEVLGVHMQPLYQECRGWDSLMRGDERYKALVAQATEIAQEAGAQLMEGLLAREIPVTSMPVVYGISADKVERLTRAERAPEQGGQLAALLERLHAAGGSVKLEVSVPRVVEAEASDGGGDRE